MSKTLNIGDPAPDFTLDTDTSSKLTLSSLRGKNVVLYFYPKDDTPGCTLEAKDFTTSHDQFLFLNTVIIGISKDNVQSHSKFKEKYCLPFTLVSDYNSKVCEEYGVWTEKSMFGKKYMGIERTTFLIDQQGIIRKIWNKVSVAGHVDEILETIKQL
ncbi:Putative peroxiredoxin bcp [Rickettsiales bacterium Ac37b]|nr:Putative peroxiredoxin bcp [Rickettsiales bacterium Ac37b]